jgi:hypothetical protein
MQTVFLGLTGLVLCGVLVVAVVSTILRKPRSSSSLPIVIHPFAISPERVVVHRMTTGQGMFPGGPLMLVSTPEPNKRRNHFCLQMLTVQSKGFLMHNIFWIIGVVVVVLILLSFFGLR